MKKCFQLFLKALLISIPAVFAIAACVTAIILASKNIIDNAWALSIALGINSLVLVFYIVLVFKMKERAIRNELRTIQNETQLVKEYYSYIDSKIDELDKLRHEMRNCVSVVGYGGLEKEDIFDLTQELERRAEDIIDKRYCENRIINIIINKEAQEAEKQGIEFDCSVAIPKDIAIDDYDLCSCVFNLLDNAIYANTFGSFDNKRFIDFKASVLSGFLIIKQKNSSFIDLLIDSKGNIVTSKKDEGHGLGLKIIKDICEKYNGYCEFEQKDGVFYSTLGLHVEKQA